MSHQNYCQLLETCNPATNSYIQTLAQNPLLPEVEYFKKFNAIINLSDICAGLDLSHPSHLGRKQIIAAIRQSDRKDSMLAYLGAQIVRTTNGGCGLSGGYQISTNSHGFQSVAEFGTLNNSLEDNYGTLEIHCEECGAIYLRTPNKLEERCRCCGGTKGIAC